MKRPCTYQTVSTTTWFSDAEISLAVPRSSLGKDGFLALIWAIVGLGWGGVFLGQWCLPLGFLAAAMAVQALLGCLLIRSTSLSLYPRFMVFIYWLPFSGMLGYLFETDYVWRRYPPLAEQLCTDPAVMNHLFDVGLAGLAGLCCGIHLVTALTGGRRLPTSAGHPLETIPFSRCILLAAVAVFFAWLHASPETVFVSQYAREQSASLASEAGFSAAFLLSYALLVLLQIDAIREPWPNLRAAKSSLLWAILLFVTAYFQLLRGERDCAGALVGIAALYATAPTEAQSWRERTAVLRARLRRVILPLGLTTLVLLVVGVLRSVVAEEGLNADLVEERLAVLSENNTWTALASTNLAMARESADGDVEYFYGRTYWEYLLSIPPGPVAKWLHYERPISRDAGPGRWYMPFTVGGLHPVIVPFRNFGIVGVFVVLALQGALIGLVERWNEQGSLLGRIAYGYMFMIGFLWFWYGDMNMIRGVMMVPCAYLLYRCLCRRTLHDAEHGVCNP